MSNDVFDLIRELVLPGAPRSWGVGIGRDEGKPIVQPDRDTAIVEARGLASHLTGEIGFTRAKEFILLGRSLAVETARDWGLVHSVVAADKVGDEAAELAAGISKAKTWVDRRRTFRTGSTGKG